MADKQITEFPAVVTLSPDDVFHVHTGSNSKIVKSDLFDQIDTELLTSATMSEEGIVQLTDSVSSTSTTTAATPNSVKQAYDLANAAVPNIRVVDAGKGITGGGGLLDDITITLGTPSTLSTTSTNNTTANSHTHEVDFPVTSVNGQTGDVVISGGGGDIVSSPTDTTPGRITDVGWMGLGAQTIDYDNTEPPHLNGYWRADSSVTGASGIGSSNHNILQWGSGARRTQLISPGSLDSTARLYLKQFSTSNVADGPYQVYTTREFELVDSPTDTTADRVPTVGWMGLGRGIQLDEAHDLLTLPGLYLGSESMYWWSSGVGVPANVPSNTSSLVKRTYWSSNAEKLEVWNASTGERSVNTKLGGTWTGWQEVGSGGGGGTGLNPAATQTFSSSDQDGSGSITITLDTSSNNFFELDLRGSPLPSAAGAFQVTVENIDTSTIEAGQIWVRGAGRKTFNLTFEDTGSSTLTNNWASTPVFSNSNAEWELISYWYSRVQNQVMLSLNDGR